MTALYTVLQLAQSSPRTELPRSWTGFQGRAGTVRHDMDVILSVEHRLVEYNG